MPRQIWEKEERIEYRELFREYKREGYEPEEAKRLARQDVKEIMGDKIDFATDLYNNTLKDLD